MPEKNIYTEIDVPTKPISIILYFRISVLIILIFIFALNLFAIEINRAEIIGSSVDLDIAESLIDIKGDFSEQDIEAIGIKITNEYHAKGYTTSYVEKLAVNKDGVLKIHVKESRILAINVSGAKGKEKEEVESLFKSFIGNVYNRYLLEKRAETVKYEYNLSAVKIYPVNYKDTSDVFLSVMVEKKTKGNFYGGIGFEPIYGITPMLGYYHPFADSAVDIYSRVGYRDDKVRRAEGDVKYFLFTNNSAGAIYIGANISMFVEQWESRDKEYERKSLSPVLGYRYMYKYLILDLYFSETASNIEDYKDNDKTFRDYDSRLTLDLGFSNKVNLLSKKDSTDIKLSVSSGKSDLNEKVYLISSAEGKSAASLSTNLRIIPRLYSYYTTSNERYFWQYVYDKRLLGFFNKYTASKWKNTAEMAIEYEIIPQFIYAGPFVNYGYFLNEFDKWTSKAGGGVKSTIELKNAYIEIYYAWDLSKGPSEGGLAVLAGGRF